MFVPINLNAKVRFRLTETGVKVFEVLAAQEQVSLGLPERHRRKLEPVEVHEWPLHDFANFFGQALHAGAPVIVVDNSIEVEPNDVANAAGS